MSVHIKGDLVNNPSPKKQKQTKNKKSKKKTVAVKNERCGRQIPTNKYNKNTA